MDQTVKAVLEKYSNSVEYHRVDFMHGEGKKRFLELSCVLFGEEMVKKYCGIAPIPSLFIDGALVFDSIPSVEDLRAWLDRRLA